MGRQRQFRSSRTSREPFLASFDDGREYAFPADVAADAVLDFMERYGESVSPADLPNAAFLEMAEFAAGAEGLAWLRANTTWTEMLDVLGWIMAELKLSAEAASATERSDPPEEASPAVS